jgi:predicted histone-like DNA-binding protein
MIRYKIVKRPDPRDLAKPEKYFAAAKNDKSMEFRDFIDDIADRSTVNTPDIVAVLEALFQLIPEYLMMGRIVRLGDLGTFTIKIVSEGEENEKDVNKKSIKNVIVRFIASKLLRNKFKSAHYEKYSQERHG